jgi:hypothetical protein
MAEEQKSFSLDYAYLRLKEDCLYLDKDWCNREGHPCTLKSCQLAETYLYSLKVARRKGLKHI